MKKAKPSAGRRVFNAILLILDLALLAWIILSWNGHNVSAAEPSPGSAVTVCADDAVSI